MSVETSVDGGVQVIANITAMVLEEAQGDTAKAIQLMMAVIEGYIVSVPCETHEEVSVLIDEVNDQYMMTYTDIEKYRHLMIDHPDQELIYDPDFGWKVHSKPLF